MSDWIKHNGGPQPVADDVWVSLHEPDGYVIARLGLTVSWQKQTSYGILNQHLIDAALKRGIELGLEAAAREIGERQELASNCPDGGSEYLRTDHMLADLRALDPETIARDAADKETAR